MEFIKLEKFWDTDINTTFFICWNYVRPTSYWRLLLYLRWDRFSSSSIDRILCSVVLKFHERCAIWEKKSKKKYKQK